MGQQRTLRERETETQGLRDVPGEAEEEKRDREEQKEKKQKLGGPGTEEMDTERQTDRRS